jgi:Leucine-rich repeat (LRR) protein
VLPEEFVQLRNLEVLSINGDSQFDLRRNIPLLSQLPKLRELHLEGDNFRDIPPGIKNLTSLEQLYLNDNDLNVIPEAVKEMKNLRYLDLSKNPVPHIQGILIEDTLAPRIVIKF